MSILFSIVDIQLRLAVTVAPLGFDHSVLRLRLLSCSQGVPSTLQARRRGRTRQPAVVTCLYTRYARVFGLAFSQHRHASAAYCIARLCRSQRRVEERQKKCWSQSVQIAISKIGTADPLLVENQSASQPASQSQSNERAIGNSSQVARLNQSQTLSCSAARARFLQSHSALLARLS